MHPGTLRALEWDQIVDLVSGFALTPLGAARLAELQPQTDPSTVSQLLAATTEGVKYLDHNPAFALHAPEDLAAILASVAVEGRPLEPLRLLNFADFLDSVGLTCANIRRVSGPYPTLKATAENCGQFKPQITEVRRQIDPSGEVNDSASPELGRLRTQLRKQRTRLRSTLESYLRGKETAKYLQDQVISDRDGRYVLVVKAEHRTSIPGIIHGSSGSGASLYLEPLSTVEINNEIVAVEQQEREEVLRILAALTDAFRAKPIELRQAIDAATELDVIQAKARCAHLLSGVAPAIAPDGRVELRGARHPLLIPGVVARLVAQDFSPVDRAEALSHRDPDRTPRREPVPVDVLAIPPTTVLLITGPNTGGKTVALKTAGLLSLMAQAGLWVPAIEARLPIFRSVFADIGDEQSIASNLSTFSWHITNIASMDRSLALPALVLLDELGAGTDPLEGGALGVAIIEHFRARGAVVISTTHYEALKTYAATTSGVTAAGFGFTPDTYEPTYHIQYGSPGRSLALEMAGRLGLNGSIIDSARKNLSEREAQLAEHLAKVDADLRALEHERRLVKRERESLIEADTRAKSREEALRQREDTFKQKLNEKLDERLREARLQIDTIVGDLRKQASGLQAPSTGDTGRLRSEARAALESAADNVRRDEAVASPAPPESTRPADVGDRVLIKGLGLEGTLVMLHDREAEVDVRGKRFRAHTGDLRVLDGPSRREPATVRVNVQVQPREQSSSELLLVGQTVDQAIGRLEKFLDESLLTDQRTLRLIHGFGTGRLKEAIGEFLQRHPLVSSVRTATAEEGGGGVTIAELKD